MRSEWPRHRVSIAGVGVFLLLDCLFSVLAYLSLHRYSVRRSDLSWSAFTSFRRDALDTVFSVVLRVLLLVAVLVFCLAYATPDYDAALEEKQRQARLHNRRVSRQSGAKERRSSDSSDHSAHTREGSEDDEKSASVSLSINGGSKTEPLLPSSSPYSLADSNPDTDATLTPVPSELSQTEKHAVNQRCSRYRVAGYVFIFVLCTAMQVCIGVKVVSFDFPDGAEWPIATFLALPILFINIEQHYLSRVIGRMTREEGQLASQPTSTRTHACEQPTSCSQRFRGA